MRTRKPANRTRNRSMTLKTTEEVRAKLDQSVAVSGRSLTHEVEYLVGKALDAETLEATLRRVVREECRNAVAWATDPGTEEVDLRELREMNDPGIQGCHTHSVLSDDGQSVTRPLTIPRALNDALDIMAEAQGQH